MITSKYPKTHCHPFLYNATACECRVNIDTEYQVQVAVILRHSFLVAVARITDELVSYELIMADDDYHRLHSEFIRRTDYDVVFREALDDLAGKVDISWVKSCVAFGTGSGEREIELVRRLLPNLREFHAVESDAESAAALRENLQAGRLPGAETTAVDETSVGSWSGVDSPVDAVLLISMLPEVHVADRKALFHKLASNYLNPGGIHIVREYLFLHFFENLKKT